jgi:hypothetical protein
MGRRAGQVRHAMGGEPGEVIRDRFAGARQDERAAADHGAQEDLQPAIAAYIVEGAPYRSCGAGLDRRGEARDIVAHQLGNAGGARGQQHPFGPPAARGLHVVIRGLPLDRRAASDVKRDPESAGVGRVAIRHDRIDLGSRDDGAKMVLRDVGRTDDEAAGDAVQFDHRHGRRELIAGGDEDGALTQRAEPAAETGAVDQVGQRHALTRASEMPRRPSAAIEPAPQRQSVILRHFRRRARSRRA